MVATLSVEGICVVAVAIFVGGVVVIVVIGGEIGDVGVIVVVGDTDTIVEVSRARFLMCVVSSTMITWVLSMVPVNLTATGGMAGSAIVSSTDCTHVCRSLWNPGTGWDAFISSSSGGSSGGGRGGKTLPLNLLGGDQPHRLCCQRSSYLLLLILSSGESNFAIDSDEFEVGSRLGDVSCGEDFFDGRLGCLERRCE